MPNSVDQLNCIHSYKYAAVGSNAHVSFQVSSLAQKDRSIIRTLG